MRSRVGEPGVGSHSGHNWTGLVRNGEVPAGWGMTRMASNPGDAAVHSQRTVDTDCSSWKQGDVHLTGAFPKPTLTVSIRSLSPRSREIDSNLEITPIKLMKKRLLNKNARVLIA